LIREKIVEGKKIPVRMKSKKEEEKKPSVPEVKPVEKPQEAAA